MNRLFCGDAGEVLRTLPDGYFDTCVTSPPYYGLRDYGDASQIGVESTPEDYIGSLVGVFREVWRTLKDDGTLWVNIGDTYAANRTYQVPDSKSSDVGNYMPMRVPNGCKSKDLIGIPWMLAFALRSDGWYLRNDIIWNKTNAMPESVVDRCTASYEHIFLLSKSRRYFFDSEAIKEPALSSKNKSGMEKRNKRDVWSVSKSSYKGAHFAVFPPDLIEPCVLAGSRKGGTVLDPFLGSGTTALVSMRHGRECVGIDINPSYLDISRERLEKEFGTDWRGVDV